MNFTKPLFEYSDIELKAIAYDHHELIAMYQRNLQIIKNELERRRLSTVIATQNSIPVN